MPALLEEFVEAEPGQVTDLRELQKQARVNTNFMRELRDRIDEVNSQQQSLINEGRGEEALSLDSAKAPWEKNLRINETMTSIGIKPSPVDVDSGFREDFPHLGNGRLRQPLGLQHGEMHRHHAGDERRRHARTREFSERVGGIAREDLVARRHDVHGVPTTAEPSDPE